MTTPILLKNKPPAIMEFDYSSLRAIMAKKGMSIKTLANTLGVSYGVTVRWINEKQAIPERRKLQIQTILQIPDGTKSRNRRS